MTIAGISAPELRVSHWIDGSGKARDPLKLADLGAGHKILYCFQYNCPGCHARGFPTLKKLVNELADQNFGFAVVQTAFEEFEHNTPDKLKEVQDKYDLRLPFGHDQVDGDIPTIMSDYRTNGTPWFIVIDPQGTVIHDGFDINPNALLKPLERGHTSEHDRR